MCVRIIQNFLVALRPQNMRAKNTNVTKYYLYLYK